MYPKIESNYSCLDGCDFDSILNEAEKYKQLILDNIGDLASNFAEDTPFEATGEEPQWLLSALLKAGAEFGGGGDDDDEDDATLTSSTKSEERESDEDFEARIRAKLKNKEAQPKGEEEGYYLFTSSEVIKRTPEQVERMNKLLTDQGMEACVTIEVEPPKYIHFCYSLSGVNDLIESALDEFYTAELLEITTPVTGFFFDEECSDPSEGYEVVLNSKEQLEIYHETKNSHGHLVWLWWRDAEGTKHKVAEGGVGDW